MTEYLPRTPDSAPSELTEYIVQFENDFNQAVQLNDEVGIIQKANELRGALRAEHDSLRDSDPRKDEIRTMVDALDTMIDYAHNDVLDITTIHEILERLH